jgi:hypothetical protein
MFFLNDVVKPMTGRHSRESGQGWSNAAMSSVTQVMPWNHGKKRVAMEGMRQ